jgi:hypothetical protein
MGASSTYHRAQYYQQFISTLRTSDSLKEEFDDNCYIMETDDLLGVPLLASPLHFLSY